MNKQLKNWTLKELEALDSREWLEDEVGEFDSIIILPTKHKHDSGFRNMDFIGVKGEEPICKLSGCSDIINIRGFDNNLFWAVDCLYTSKLLRIFVHGHKIKVGPPLSSFDIYAVKI